MLQPIPLALLLLLLLPLPLLAASKDSRAAPAARSRWPLLPLRPPPLLLPLLLPAHVLHRGCAARFPPRVSDALQALPGPAQLQQQYKYRIVLLEHLLGGQQAQRPARLHVQLQAGQLSHTGRRRWRLT